VGGLVLEDAPPISVQGCFLGERRRPKRLGKKGKSKQSNRRSLGEECPPLEFDRREEGNDISLFETVRKREQKGWAAMKFCRSCSRAGGNFGKNSNVGGIYDDVRGEEGGSGSG